MKLYIIFGSVLAILAAFGGAYLSGRSHGIESCQNTNLIAQNKEARNEAQNFANRPRTRDDRVKRLCEWAVIRAKNEGKPIKQLPSFCSERIE